MPTPNQIRVIQIARSQLVKAGKLTEPGYRMILRACGGVESSKLLSNASIERVMAMFETLGFVDSIHGKGYWQGKVSRQQDALISDRQVRAIETMAAQSRYPLESLIRRLTNHRTDKLREIYEGEAYKVHEALKAIVDREEQHDQREREISIVPGEAVLPAAAGIQSGRIEEEEEIPF